MAQRRNWRTRGEFSRGVSDTISLPETLRQLREMGEHVIQAAKNALEIGVNEIVTDAKSRCPVKTGKLRNSIRAVPNREKTSYRIVADAKDDNGFAYGQVVEFSPKINKPFLYPAFDANYGRIQAKIREAIGRALETGRA